MDDSGLVGRRVRLTKGWNVTRYGIVIASKSGFSRGFHLLIKIDDFYCEDSSPVVGYSTDRDTGLELDE